MAGRRECFEVGTPSNFGLRFLLAVRQTGAWLPAPTGPRPSAIKVRMNAPVSVSLLVQQQSIIRLVGPCLSPIHANKIRTLSCLAQQKSPAAERPRGSQSIDGRLGAYWVSDDGHFGAIVSLAHAAAQRTPRQSLSQT